MPTARDVLARVKAENAPENQEEFSLTDDDLNAIDDMELEGDEDDELIDPPTISPPTTAPQFEKLKAQVNLSPPNGIVLETTPRITAIKLAQTELNQDVIFYTRLGRSELYINAIRQVFSRARKRARKLNKKMEEFKLVTVNTERVDNYDRVIMRRMPEHTIQDDSLYDELLGILAKKEDAK